MLIERVLNRLCHPLGVNPFPRAFRNPIEARAGSTEEIFDEIYRVNYWGSGESVSGVGSELNFTRKYQGGLARTLRDFSIREMFDAPCGDLNWMSGFLEDNVLVYSGGDISREVVARARSRHPEFALRVFDITSDRFPQADLWHCRDCLFHLPFDAIHRALENFVASDIKYALVTSHSSRILHRNLDVGPGGFRLLDLRCPPFFLPQPLARIPDYRWGHDFPRFVCLWTREQVAGSLSSKVVS